MILQTAIEQHRRQQNPERYWDEDLDSINDYAPFAMTRIVGGIVASELGEFVSWDTFDNCREHGLTVSTPGGWTFCWYEHRNSDVVHIEGCPTSEVREWGPYGGDDKWDTLAEFWPKTYEAVAKCLVEMIRHTIERSTTRADLKAIGLRHGNVELERRRHWASFARDGGEK